MNSSDDFNRLIGLPTPDQLRARIESVAKSRAASKAVAEGRSRTVGRTDVIRGTVVKCIEADARTGVVLEAVASDADLNASWPLGERVQVGGFWFKVKAVSRRRVTLEPVGNRKDADRPRDNKRSRSRSKRRRGQKRRRR